MWIYDRDRLTFYQRQNGDYQTSLNSQVFPSLAITTKIPELVQAAIDIGPSAMLRNLRRQLTATYQLAAN